jgi:CRP-like cAMP-binding protein
MARELSTIPSEALERAQRLLSTWQIPPEFVVGLLEHRFPITFAKGDPVFTQGSAADVAYLVLSGWVKVYIPLSYGDRVVVQVAGAGDFIGMVETPGTHARQVQALEAEAMSKASVAIFTRDHVLAMLKSVAAPRLVALLENVNTSWSESFLWCVKFLGLSFRDRLLLVLQSLAQRCGVREARGVLLTIELSHKDLAEMIASSRPMASRLVCDLCRQGQLARQGRHYILVSPDGTDSARPLRLLPNPAGDSRFRRILQNRAPLRAATPK